MVRPWTGDFLRDGRLNGRNGEKKKSHKKNPWAVGILGGVFRPITSILKSGRMGRVRHTSPVDIPNPLSLSFS
jgi:hypothetical protein